MSHPEEKDNFVRAESRDYYRFIRRAKTLLLVFSVFAGVQGVLGTIHPNPLVFGTAIICFSIGIPGCVYIWSLIRHIHAGSDARQQDLLSGSKGRQDEIARVREWYGRASKILHVSTVLLLPGIVLSVAGALLQWNPLIPGMALALTVISAFVISLLLVARFKAEIYLHALSR